MITQHTFDICKLNPHLSFRMNISSIYAHLVVLCMELMLYPYYRPLRVHAYNILLLSLHVGALSGIRYATGPARGHIMAVRPGGAGAALVAPIIVKHC